MCSYNAYNSIMTIMIREVDQELHKRFKLECTHEGVSMNKKLHELIREYVERREEERKQNRLAL